MHFIFNDMMRVVQNKELTLVYGMAISNLLREIGLDTRCDSESAQDPSTYLGLHSLRIMGYIQNDENIWVKKNARVNPIENGENEEDGHDEDQKPNVGASSSGHFDSQGALETIMAKLDSLTTFVEAMHRRQNEMFDQLQQIRGFQENIGHLFRNF